MKNNAPEQLAIPTYVAGDQRRVESKYVEQVAIPTYVAGDVPPKTIRIRHWGYPVGILWGVIAYLGLVQIEAGCAVIQWFGSGLDKSLSESAGLGFITASLILGFAIMPGSPKAKMEVVSAAIVTFAIVWLCGPKQLPQDPFGDTMRYPQVVLDCSTGLLGALAVCVGIQLVIQLISRRMRGDYTLE